MLSYLKINNIALIDELEGSEFDMKGLADLKKLLGGE